MYVYSKMDINKPTAVQNMWRNVLDICRNSVNNIGHQSSSQTSVHVLCKVTEAGMRSS
jgi:hypothetical protein